MKFILMQKWNLDLEHWLCQVKWFPRRPKHLQMKWLQRQRWQIPKQLAVRWKPHCQRSWCLLENGNNQGNKMLKQRCARCKSIIILKNIAGLSWMMLPESLPTSLDMSFKVHMLIGLHYELEYVIIWQFVVWSNAWRFFWCWCITITTHCIFSAVSCVYISHQTL